MRLLFTLLILALGAWLGFFLYQNPGDVQLSYQDWVITIQLRELIVIILALVVVYTLLAAIFKGYRKIKEWITGASLRAVAKNANHGWLALAEGDWSKAEAALLKAAKNSEYPAQYYLEAAKAAQELGALDRRDSAIRAAMRAAPEAQVAISLTQAELYLTNDQLDLCLATLHDLCKLAPHNVLVLRLAAKVFVNSNEWAEIIKLLPLFKKHAVLNPEDLIFLEARAYNFMLQNEAKKYGQQGLVTFWDTLPKSAKQQPMVIHEYVKLLLELGDNNEAEQIIRNTLKRQWDIGLVKLYGLTISSDLSKQISTAETWLRSHLSEPVLLLALARLCLANKLWGKARNYLDASLALEPNADAYAELGRLLGFLGEQQKSLDSYKKGLLEFAAILPIEGALK